MDCISALQVEAIFQWVFIEVTSLHQHITLLHTGMIIYPVTLYIIIYITVVKDGQYFKYIYLKYVCELQNKILYLKSFEKTITYFVYILVESKEAR